MAYVVLDDEEQKRLNDWYEKHNEHHHGGKIPYGGAIGGAITLMVTQTGLGSVLKVRCGHCKDKDFGTGDLTDYDCW